MMVQEPCLGDLLWAPSCTVFGRDLTKPYEGAGASRPVGLVLKPGQTAAVWQLGRGHPGQAVLCPCRSNEAEDMCFRSSELCWRRGRGYRGGDMGISGVFWGWSSDWVWAGRLE